MTEAARPVELWYEFSSPYSYLAVMRAGALARARGRAVVWRPFVLGPIFAERGWSTSPFNIYEDKGRYMWRDVAREAAVYGIDFRRPSRFPVHTVLAARVALIGSDEGWVEAASRALFRAYFVDDADLADPAVIDGALAGLGLDGPAVRARAESPAERPRLRAQTEAARALGIFGAPTCVVDGELFWGNDRLERALSWPPPPPPAAT
jgi:2-hydroxychromene-2-carboxylate isomerase